MFFVLFGTQGIRNRVRFALVIVATAGLVALAGLFYFRFVHGIDDIYQPTFDFIRSAPGRDPLKSPRLEWLGRFTWLYATPAVLVTATALAWRRMVVFDRTDRLALALCTTQYALQWIDQFARDGNGLEISYYWSMSYPSLAVALAAVVARLTHRLRWPTAAGLTAVWCGLLVVGVPDALRLPHSVGFALIAVISIAAVIALADGLPTLAAAGLGVFVIWTQIGAPAYDPTAYHGFNMSPRYDRLYWSNGDEADALFGETLWFEDQMDRVPNDAETYFVPTASWPSTIIGIYQAHVTGRIIEMQPTLDIAIASEPSSSSTAPKR